MGRHVLSDPADPEYFNQETWLNELTVVTLADGTKKALAFVQLDENGNPVIPADVVIKGNRDILTVGDMQTQQTLVEILKELKKMNLHLSIMTDNDFKNTEVEV